MRMFCASFVGIFRRLLDPDTLATRERQRVIRADVESLRASMRPRAERGGGGGGGGGAPVRRSWNTRVPGFAGDTLTSWPRPISARSPATPRAGPRTPNPRPLDDLRQSIAVNSAIPSRTGPRHSTSFFCRTGFNLLVGRDMRAQERFQEALASAFFAALVVIVALGVVEAW